MTKKEIEDILTKHLSKDHRSGCSAISVHGIGYVANDILAALNKVASSQPIIESRQPESFIEANERARQFKADLKSLLIKHGAYMELEENESTRFAYQKGDDDIVIDSPPPMYDKHGIQIKEFTVLKVYHFYGRTLRGGNGHNYMYKWVRIKRMNGKLRWVGYHLTNDKEGFYLLQSGANSDRVMQDAEIVQQNY